MEKTMIQIKKSTREKIKSLGNMGETYDDVLNKMYDATVENMYAKTLLDTTDSTPVEEILKKRNLL